MAEKFEVTLVGNDQLGGMVDSVNEKVKDLSSSAEKAAKGLGHDLAGKDNQSGVDALEKKFSALATSAKQNVQHLGDMVPPLKTFGELSGKYFGNLGKLGLTGGLVYGISRMATTMSEMSQHAYNMDVSANNIGLSAEKLSMVLGAFRLAGIEEAPAIQSLNTISDTFNDILRGGDSGNRIMSQLAAFGFDRSMIPTQTDLYGNQTVIVDELLPVLDGIYDSIQSPQIRHEFARATGMDASMEQLLRGDASVQSRYDRAYDLGLVRLESTNQSLREFNHVLTDTSASMSGWWDRSKDGMASFLLSDGSIADGLTGVGEVFQYGDTGAWARAFGFNRGDDSQKWREIRNDPQYEEFVNTLGWLDQQKIGDFLGVLPEGAWDKFLDFKSSSNPNYQDPFAPHITQPMRQDDFYEKVFLDFISMMEGTYGRGDDGYNVTFGGKTFNNGLAYHPNIQQPFMQTDGRMNTSGAAGRYQFINRTWGGLTNQLGLTDFGKEAQDRGALELIRQNGALDAVRSGNWQGAVGRLGNEWASFPSSGHPQNHRSWQQAEQMWNRALEINSNKPIAQDIAEAINPNPTQITLRIENGRQTQTVSTQAGATISTSMDF